MRVSVDQLEVETASTQQQRGECSTGGRGERDSPKARTSVDDGLDRVAVAIADCRLAMSTHTQREKERARERQTQRETDRERERETERERHTQRERERETPPTQHTPTHTWTHLVRPSCTVRGHSCGLGRCSQRWELRLCPPRWPLTPDEDDEDRSKGRRWRGTLGWREATVRWIRTTRARDGVERGSAVRGGGVRRRWSEWVGVSVTERETHTKTLTHSGMTATHKTGTFNASKARLTRSAAAFASWVVLQPSPLMEM